MRTSAPHLNALLDHGGGVNAGGQRPGRGEGFQHLHEGGAGIGDEDERLVGIGVRGGDIGPRQNGGGLTAKRLLQKFGGLGKNQATRLRVTGVVRAVNGDRAIAGELAVHEGGDFRKEQDFRFTHAVGLSILFSHDLIVHVILLR